MTSAIAWLPRTILVTDAGRELDPRAQARTLRPGDALVLRHYESHPREREELAGSLKAICRQKKARLLIAADEKLALRVGADGVHLPRWSRARKIGGRSGLHPDWLTTASVHNEQEYVSAMRAGADAIIVSPVFGTQSHIGSAGLGIVRTAHLVTGASIPAYGMGGIRGETVRRLAGLHLAGVAGTQYA